MFIIYDQLQLIHHIASVMYFDFFNGGSNLNICVLWFFFIVKSLSEVDCTCYIEFNIVKLVGYM